MKWLSVRGVARALGVTRHRVLGLIVDGPLPGFQFGDRIKVRAEDLLAFRRNGFGNGEDGQ